MKKRLETQLEYLRSDPQFQVLMQNTYTQASDVATTPIGTRAEKLKNYQSIAELDLIMYLLSSPQIKWNGENLSVEQKEAGTIPTSI